MACRDHTRKGLAIYDRDRHDQHKHLYGGHDPGVCGLIHLGLAEWLLGFPDQALARVRHALELAHDLSHSPTLSLALSIHSYVHRFRGEVADAQALSEAQIELCEKQGVFPQHAAFGRIGRGWAIAIAGDPERGLVEMRTGLDQLGRTRVLFRQAYHLAMFAEACALAGRVEEGRQAVKRALESPERWWEAETQPYLW